MKHALEKWTFINKRIKGETILLFLDFDGTLAPIASTPARVQFPSRTKKILRQLHSLPNIKLVIISGRDLDDIKKIVGIPGIVYVGNHGCQISGVGIDWQHDFPVVRQRKMRKLNKELSITMKEIRGVLIENKNMSIAVHYRNVKNKDMPKFQKTLTKILRPYIVPLFIKVSVGKKVVEFGLATPWNKGKAVNRIIHRIKISERIDSHVSVYIGDDVTDETAFKTLKHKGITIHVGTGTQSAASYYLRNPAEVATFLGKLSTI